ncbi:branched-chain amino acid transporter permease [Streptomyces sp. NPDC048172]|uniref:branched-chain amino acid transporter permease n=1 Tax=Streptomyces sp. NPDC048172 TaxID=3365505 RepID=UPI00370F8CC6
MPDTTYLLLAAAISGAVTWALRALPFAALAPLRESRTVQYLGARMPAGIMIILFVYCLRDLRPTELNSLAPLAAVAVVIGLHLWRRSAVMSILGGTAVYVTLTSTLFA